MKLTLVAGARPNFIKIAPLIRAIERLQAMKRPITYRLIHTGQHYDAGLSDAFFIDLNIPSPHVNLGAGSGSQAQQTAAIMPPFEHELLEYRPDCVVVVGDVTSTMACSIVAKKLTIELAHVEAGIRSGDRTMPEEINRLVTDSITDYFFTTTPEAGENLIREGVDKSSIFWVGNTMIDSLVESRHKFRRPAMLDEVGVQDGNYLVVTLHRPSNVDNSERLAEILRVISVDSDSPIVFPVHPRTRKMLSNIAVPSAFHLSEPMGYLEFMYLIEHAKGIITDSGGIQEEATFLRVPCMTLRTTTERPETVTLGTNILVGDSLTGVPGLIKQMVRGDWKTGRIPEKWDGQTSNRIIAKLAEFYS